jgi:hypothetical protein
MPEASWYSANRTTVKRSEGRNAVACAAYCAGAKLYDATERMTHDYTRKRGVVEAFVTTPQSKDGLEWAHDIEALSTAMEAHEKRKDAQVGHVWRFSLPASLDADGRSAITHEAAQKLSDLYGVAVIAGIHLPDPKSDDDRNHHAYLLFTTRTVEPEGKLGEKVTSITSPKTSDVEVLRYREIVADIINDALEDAGSAERVTHLSFKARGITDIEPTIHLGPAASGLERRDELSDRGDINREILEAREAIEARLVWQQEQAQPEIDATIEADLEARFGDEFAGVMREAQAGAPLPSIEEHARQDAEPLQEDTASSGSADILAEPRGWRERMKALASHALEFFRDERGTTAPEPAVTPQPEPVTEEPTAELHSEPPARSWVSRVMEAGRHLLHGWQHRDGKEIVEGIGEAAGIARDIASTPPTPEPPGSQPPPEESNREPTRPAAQVDAAEPDDRPQEAGAKAMSAFDRLFTPEAEPNGDGKPLSDWEKYAALFNEGGEPPSRDPWTSFGEAYQRALRDQAEQPGHDEPKPEPDTPEPDHGPDIDF